MVVGMKTCLDAKSLQVNKLQVQGGGSATIPLSEVLSRAGIPVTPDVDPSLMRFTSFMPSGRQVCDAKTHTEVLEVVVALSCESIEEVDRWVERVGGQTWGLRVR
jgi:hypothetical protein